MADDSMVKVCYRPGNMPSVARIGPKTPPQIYIQRWRKYRVLTQQQLADRLGVTKGTISRWEGGTRIPDINVLAAICEALDIPLEAIYRPPPARLPGPPPPTKAELTAVANKAIQEFLKKRRA